MKAHIGVDDQSGLVHTVVGTTAKVSDMSRFGALLQATRNASALTGARSIRRSTRIWKRA